MKIVDGSLIKVVGTRSVVLSKNMILKSVLLVPNLACNLLFMSKLTKEFSCVTNCFHTYYEFQDLDLGRIIGNAKECMRLYLLEDSQHLNKQTHNARGVSFPIFSSFSQESIILLWHYRLGHPNFLYLKKLFMHLFNNINPNFLQ